MRLRSSQGWTVLLVMAAAVVGFLRSGTGDGDADEQTAVLIRQLGEPEFARRQEAGRKLEALGEKVLPALRTAGASQRNLEIRGRARQVVRAILRTSCTSGSTGLKLVVIEPGDFQMGSAKSEPGRRPDEDQHRVRITRLFLLGAYEVTQAEFEQVMKAAPSGFSATGDARDKVVGMETARFPVERATWYDAVEFCNRLSEKDGHTLYYRISDVKREGESIKSAQVAILGGNGFRLPTEAEWEYACRATTTTPFHYGSSSNGHKANAKGVSTTGYAAVEGKNLGRTAKVGSYAPNAWGLYDMHGNVGEWCGDWYDKDYYAASPEADPQGPEKGQHRVMRGGSWMISEASCRSASRFWLTPDDAKDFGGFRVCRTP